MYMKCKLSIWFDKLSWPAHKVCMLSMKREPTGKVSIPTFPVSTSACFVNSTVNSKSPSSRNGSSHNNFEANS